MASREMAQAYFRWMCEIVCDARHERKSSWQRLLRFLDEQTFTYAIDKDANRAEDGRDLRYRFCCESGERARAADAPCSVLEMMVALAIRIEEHIMDNPEAGDRTAKWFWDMVRCLGLSRMDDAHFDERAAKRIVARFLTRRYAHDGRGGLFTTVEGCPRDFRDMEIWQQMMLYLRNFS